MEQEKFECTVAQGQVGRYLSGELLPEDNLEALEQHLAECDDCRAILNDRKNALMAMLGETPAPVPKPAKKVATGEATPLVDSTLAETAEPILIEVDDSVVDPKELAELFDQVAETEPLSVSDVQSVEPLEAGPESLSEIAEPSSEIDFTHLEKLEEIVEDPLTPLAVTSELDGILAEAEQIQTPPEPDPVPEPEIMAVAKESAPEEASPVQQEDRPEEISTPLLRKLAVGGLPILLTKNLKTMAYSLSLGIVLIAMSAFAKNPSTVFGARAIKEGEKLPETHTEVKEPANKEITVDDTAGKAEPTKTETHETEPHPKPIIKAVEEVPQKHTKPVEAKHALKSYEDPPKMEKEHLPAPTPSSVEDSEYEVAKASGTVQKRIENGKVIHQPAPKPVVKMPFAKIAPQETVRKSVLRRKPKTFAPKTKIKRPVKKTRATKSTHNVKVYDSNGKAIN